MNNVDFLVKLRDASQMIVDAANEQLEKLAPATTEITATFNELDWTRKEGSNSNPYEQTTKEQNKGHIGFEALQQKLNEHNGFWKHKDFKYWFHQNDQNTIDRREI